MATIVKAALVLNQKILVGGSQTVTVDVELITPKQAHTVYLWSVVPQQIGHSAADGSENRVGAYQATVSVRERRTRMRDAIMVDLLIANGFTVPCTCDVKVWRTNLK